MKYIKLFENNSFQIISSDDYYDFVDSFRNGDSLLISIDFNEFELKKIVDIVSKYSLNINLKIKDYKVNNENDLIFRFLSEDLRVIWIRKDTDDYYYIKYLEEDYIYAKCDQINGIKNFLNSLKQI